MLSLLAALLLNSPHAAARPVVRDVGQVRCAKVQSMVERFGDVLLHSRSAYASVELYDTAYNDGCPDRLGSSAPFFVKTIDQPYCFAGYRCLQGRRGDGGGQ